MSAYNAAVQQPPQANEAAVQEQKKVPVSENTSLAKKVAAVVIALSILVMGPVKLGSLYSEAKNVFKNGTEKTYTVSAYTTIREAANYAKKLGEKVGNDELKKAAADLLVEEDPVVMVNQLAKLKFMVDDAYNEYKNGNPEENIEVTNQNRYFNDALYRLERDAYWSYADKYNSARSGFPASVMALYGGIGRLPDVAK